MKTRARPKFRVRIDQERRLYSILLQQINSEKPAAEKLYEASKIALAFRRDLVDSFILENYGLVVQSGPFRGMNYIAEAAGSLFGPKILGTYEMELTSIFSDLDRYDTFVDIGCAEGYFAVGALTTAANLKTVAFDVDPRARHLCAALAEANKVMDRTIIREMCSPEDLMKLSSQKTLVMIDIEGAEEALLERTPIRYLEKSDIIVETHQTDSGCTLDFIHRYFSQTHDVTIIEQTSRDPARFSALMALGQVDRFLAQWEGRGPEPWIFAQAKR